MGDFLLEDINQPLKHPVEKIPNKYQNYLNFSKLRNPKLNQELNKQLKNKKNRIVELEEGFSLYFNGANSEFLDKKDNKLTAISARRLARTCESRNQTLKERSTWGSATKLGFLSERGDRVIVRPSNYYSDDFEDIGEVIEEEMEIDIDDEIEEIVNGNISMEMSLNDMRCLRQSLDPNKKSFQFDEVSENEEKIVTLKLKSNDIEILNQMTSNENQLKEIIDRVLKMDLNQQRKLLDTLEKIETYHDSENFTTVSLVIEENWGHPSKVGMTEVEFLDEHKVKLPVRDIKIVSNLEESCQLQKLTNGKKNTSKQKNMWSSNWENGKSLKIDFGLKIKSIEELHYVAIYNFNQSLDSLNMGVKKVILQSATDDILCVGIIEKSFGNLAFNPPTVLTIKHSNSKIDCTYYSSDDDDDDECLMMKLHNSRISKESLNKNLPISETTEQKSEIMINEDMSNQDIEILTFRSGIHTERDENLFEKNSKFIKCVENPSRPSPNTVDKRSAKFTNIYENQTENENILLLNDSTDLKKNSAKFGRRSDLIDISETRDSLKDFVAQFEKEKNDVTLKPENSLESSWKYLKLFNKSQVGRLSLDQKSEDIMDQCFIDQKSNEKFDIDTGLEFVIPELPEGQELKLNILSTWGDPHYVGLTGIEMFAASGEKVAVLNIAADPSDINILPGYGNDPRVVKNLLDGVNRTRDDVHMWLAPFTANQSHVITITFVEPVCLAMMRIWNYNKSRIHSSRGARDVEISLDNALIFKGEIARVGECCNEIPDFGEVILFTNDDLILDQIGLNDLEFSDCTNANVDDYQSRLADQTNELLTSLVMRPPTAKETVINNYKNVSSPETLKKINVTTRPYTTSTRQMHAINVNKSTTIKLGFVESWGDQFYIGLTGIQLINEDGESIPFDSSKVSTNLESLDEKDVRKLDNIFDGINLTTEDEHMWLAIYKNNAENFLQFSLDSESKIYGIKVWNYNKSLEDSYRGVKVLNVWLDDIKISPEEGFFLRRAPGHNKYDFVQHINFQDKIKLDENLIQYQHLPCGFVYQFNIFSTWNDMYYIGLNGIELYDHLARRIVVRSNQIYAYPDSVNALTPKNQQSTSNLDVRTPDKLVDNVNNTFDPKHMWLAPILPGCLNKIFLVFDRPVSVSMIRIWNYSKTPGRGMKDFAVLVDDLLIYSGTLPCANSSAISRGILPNMNETIPPSHFHKTILFDKNNQSLVEMEKSHILKHNVSTGQDVVLINDNDYNSTKFVNQNFRPLTSVKSRSQVK